MTTFQIIYVLSIILFGVLLCLFSFLLFEELDDDAMFPKFGKGFNFLLYAKYKWQLISLFIISLSVIVINIVVHITKYG